jgi:hypothetical protein
MHFPCTSGGNFAFFLKKRCAPSFCSAFAAVLDYFLGRILRPNMSIFMVITSALALARMGGFFTEGVMAI